MSTLFLIKCVIVRISLTLDGTPVIRYRTGIPKLTASADEFASVLPRQLKCQEVSVALLGNASWLGLTQLITIDAAVHHHMDHVNTERA